MDKIILGPCSLENLAISKEILDGVYPLVSDKEFYFKASFDKANRTSIHSERGIGLKKSIGIFKELKNLYPNLKITTDVHTVEEIKELSNSNVIDLIQIPAFLCRQTDLLYFAAMNFKKVNVKKGQWLSPDKVKYIVEKIKYANTKTEVWITERGTAFGYNKLVVDFDAVDTLKSYADQVILDCTHSTQKTIEHNYTSGNPELGKKYMQVAKTFGYDGIFAEIHPTPNKALSDKDSIIDLTWITNNLTNIL